MRQPSRAAMIVAGTVAILAGGFAVTSPIANAASSGCDARTQSNVQTQANAQAQPGARVGLGAAAPGRPTVWLAGDSTMANPSGNCPVGWGSKFAEYFNSDVAVVNRAVSGRSIQTWLYEGNVTTRTNAAGECVVSPATYAARWQSMLDSSTGMRAGDFLIVGFGINDGATTCPRHVGSARFRELLGAMATAAKQRGVQPIFLTPVAAITCSGRTAKGNRGFVTETSQAAAANDVPLIDLHQLSVNLYNKLNLCPNDGTYTTGAVGAFFCNDHTHFEAEGARQIAGVVAAAVRNQRLGLAGYLKQ